MKKCVLFGVGSFFESHPELYPHDFEILGYGYSDPYLSTSKSCKLKNGKPIFSPKEIVELQLKEKIYVVICSGPWSSYDIFLKLRETGVSVNLIIFVDESLAFKFPWRSIVDKKGNVITNINGNKFVAILSDKYGGLSTNITSIDRYNSSLFSYFKYLNLAFGKNEKMSSTYDRSINQIVSEIEKSKKELAPNKIKIAIRSLAGLGDDISVCRFIFALKQNISNIEVDFFSKQGNKYENLQFIDHSYSNSQFSFVKSFEYDLVLDGFIPVVLKSDSEKIKKISPKLYEYCQYCSFIEKNFYSSNDISKLFLHRDFTEYSSLVKAIAYKSFTCIKPIILSIFSFS